MKTMAVAAWKWILVGALVAVIGVLLIAGGKKRGTRLYRWRVSLWATVLTLLGGGMLMVGCPAEKDDGTANGPKDVQDVQQLCYSDMQPQPDQVLCYAPDMNVPDEPQTTCYADVQLPDNSQDQGPMCYMPPLEVQDDPAPTCYAIDIVTPPGEVQPTCYADVGSQEDLVPTCYKPLPPDAVSDVHDGGFPDVPGPTCYAPPFDPDVTAGETQDEVVQEKDVPGPTCYMPPPPDGQ